MIKRLFKMIFLFLFLAVLFPLTCFAQTEDILPEPCDFEVQCPRRCGFFFSRTCKITFCNPEPLSDGSCEIWIEDIKIIEVLSRSEDCITVRISIPSRLSGFKPGEKEMCISCGDQEYCCTQTIK